MAENRRVHAIFTGVKSVEQEDLVGVMLTFEPLRSRIVTETIEDFAELGSDQDVSVVSGVGKVMRILRCARISAPRTPEAYMDKPTETCALLERALNVELLLELKARSRVHFSVWTENGVETVRDVKEVVELEDGFLAVPFVSAFATFFSRKDIVRQNTEVERWYDVVDIQRA
jgi:hypothetical protein